MMTRRQLRATRSPDGGSRPLVALTLAAAVAFVPCPAAAQDGIAEGPLVSGHDVSIFPPSATARFRFLPDQAWHRFDRELRLSAAPGEERRYSLEIDGGGGPERREYVVDRRRPEPPSATPAGDIFEGRLAPELRCEEGARAFWALFGPEGGPPSFAAYGEGSRPEMEAPERGTATYTLLAYAEDVAGNRSPTVRFVYRAAEPGLPADRPAQDPPPPSPRSDAGLPLPRVVSSPGSLELRQPLAAGESLLVSVNPARRPSRHSDFLAIEPEGGAARLVIGCPYGWSGEIKVYHGLLKGGAAYLAPEPLVLPLSYPALDPPPPPAPERPSVASDSAGRGSFIVFPSYPGTILASVDGGPEAPYSGPIAVKPGVTEALVAWRGEDGSGSRSETRTARLAFPPPIPDVRLLGVEDGAVVGSDLLLVTSRPAAVRYELRAYSTAEGSGRASEESLPPEPGPASPLVGDGLKLACPPGELRRFVLRYRPFSGEGPEAAAGEGRVLRFAIDREPPEPPRPSLPLPPYVDRQISVSFDQGEPGSVLFASVGVDGGESPFSPVDGPLDLPGSDLGPVAYRLRAYRVDAAGNRSADMPAASIVVDRSSVYVASDAAPGGDGSPQRPYRTLDEALASAIAGGKRSVNVRGRLEMRSAIATRAPIDINGGFGPAWARDRSARAELRVAVPAGVAAFAADGAPLTLRGLSIAFAAPGGAALCELASAHLLVEDCEISALSAGDLLLVRAASSKVGLVRSSIRADRAMSFAVARADDSEVELRDCAIAARQGVRAFSAFDLEGGSLSISGALIESAADLALRLLALRGARLDMDRSLVRVDSGTGYLRLGSFSSVEGEIRNSRFLVSWNGECLLFETEGRRTPAFRHDTVTAQTLRGKLDFFRSSGAVPEVWNSILSCASGGGVLLRCDEAPRPGSLVADCVWGFESLVAGAVEARTLDALDALNAGSAAFSSRRHVSEPPSRTFAAPVKSISPLARGSACVDAAYPLDGEAYARDFRGADRPQATGARLPDIGADELGD